MRLKKCLLLLLVALAAWAPAQADELTKERHADIAQLPRVTGAVAMGKQMATAVTAQLAQNLNTTQGILPSTTNERKILSIFSRVRNSCRKPLDSS